MITSTTTPTRRITQKQRIDALDDIWKFADLIKFQGGSEKFADIHRELAIFVTAPQDTTRVEDVIDRERRRLILMPRGHLKSTVAVSLYTLWRIYRNPDIRILVGTNLKRLARSFIRELRQYLEDEELQKLVWHVRPHIPGVLVPALDAAGKRRRNSSRNDEDSTNEALDKKVIWSSEALQVIRPGKFKEPTVAAISVGTTITGDHYDLLILDDIVDFKNSDIPSKREKITNWAQDLESVLDPLRESFFGTVNGRKLVELIGDEVLVTGTRYYDGDYYSEIFKNQEEIEYVTFIRNIYKNGKDDTEGFLWSKFTAKTIQKLRKRLSARIFAAQYLNEIMTDEERIFKKELIKWLHASKVEVKDRRTLIKRDLDDEHKLSKLKGVDPAEHIELRPILVIDSAISQSSKADYTSIGVGAYDHEGNFYLLDLRVGRWLPSETISKTYELVEKWQLAGITIETGHGLGLSLLEAFRQSFMGGKRKAVVLREFKSSVAKEARIQDNLEPLFTNSLFHATTWVGNIQEFKDEIDFYPRSAHDDVLDVIAMIAALAKPTRQNRQNRSNDVSRNPVNKKYGGTR